MHGESGAQEGSGFGGVEVTCPMAVDVPKAMNRATITRRDTLFMVMK
jgi:hypothetical protein